MKSLKAILLTALLVVTAACGGGGGGTPAPTTTVSGVAAAGIIKGGTVQVFAPYSSLSGADKKQIGSNALTDPVTGAYSVNLGTYTGPVIVEVSGGSYVDEATGATSTIDAATPLRAVAVSATGTVNVAVTPLTDLAAKQAATLAGAGTKITEAAINQANTQISDLFKVADIVTTQPLDAGAPLVGTQAQKDYTLALAAISQLANDPTQLATKLAEVAAGIDATGVMDPVVAGNISTALTTFVTTNTNNNTGVTTVPEALQELGKTSVTLTLVLAGTGVKGVQTDIVLPADVSVATDTTGATLSEVLTNLIGGTNVSLVGSSVSAGSMRLIFNRADATAMPAGDILTVKVQVAAGVAAPAASAFALSNTSLKDTNGALVSGATLSIR